MTKRSPFVVLQVDDMMDKDGVVQGEPGYDNVVVLPNDHLLRVDGNSVEHATLHHLHELLGGSVGSTVQLGFSRAQTGEEYTITVTRHAPHVQRKAKLASAVTGPDAAQDGDGEQNPPTQASPVDKNRIAVLEARVMELEKEQANCEIKTSQLALERHQAQQECKDLRRAVEDLKESDRIRATVMAGKQKDLDNEKADVQKQTDLLAEESARLKIEHDELCKKVQQLTEDLQVEQF